MELEFELIEIQKNWNLMKLKYEETCNAFSWQKWNVIHNNIFIGSN